MNIDSKILLKGALTHFVHVLSKSSQPGLYYPALRISFLKQLKHFTTIRVTSGRRVVETLQNVSPIFDAIHNHRTLETSIYSGLKIQ